MAIYDYSSGGFPTSPVTDDTLAMKGTTYKYNGSAWEVQTGGTTSFTYTATSGQTAFTGADTGSKTLAYTAASLHVFLNGILLDAADYTATDGTTVTLAVGATTGDELQVVAYGVLVSSGGGGGGWTEISSTTVSTAVASLAFSSLSLSAYSVVRLEMYEMDRSNNLYTYIKISNDNFTTLEDWPLNGTVWFDNTKTAYDMTSNASRAGGLGDSLYLIPHNAITVLNKKLNGYIEFILKGDSIIVTGVGTVYDDGPAPILWTGVIDVATFTDIKIECDSGTITAGKFRLAGMA